MHTQFPLRGAQNHRRPHIHNNIIRILENYATTKWDKAKLPHFPLHLRWAPRAYRELFSFRSATTRSRLRLSAFSPLKAAHSLLMKTLRISFGYIQFFSALRSLLNWGNQTYTSWCVLLEKNIKFPCIMNGKALERGTGERKVQNKWKISWLTRTRVSHTRC